MGSAVSLQELVPTYLKSAVFIGWGFHADEKVGDCEKSTGSSTIAIGCFSGMITRVALPLETQVASYKFTPQASGRTLKALGKFGKNTLKALESCGIGVF
ncbi:hypothetical protein [Microcoleus sp. herbarium13]|uniref:hypothetical protein n=1 Tax=Microcoleus sp. herbarium13 TaxID=3055438 RepID=UPI002FD75089